MAWPDCIRLVCPWICSSPPLNRHQPQRVPVIQRAGAEHMPLLPPCKVQQQQNALTPLQIPSGCFIYEQPPDSHTGCTLGVVATLWWSKFVSAGSWQNSCVSSCDRIVLSCFERKHAGLMCCALLFFWGADRLVHLVPSSFFAAG